MNILENKHVMNVNCHPTHTTHKNLLALLCTNIKIMLFILKVSTVGDLKM